MIQSNKYHTITPWYEPSDKLRVTEKFLCEMSREEHGFLCGIIRLCNPKKILEIGVAEGGTTAVIMTALNKLKLSSEVISVDINKNLYCNSQLETGYVYKLLQKTIEGNSSHKFLFGHTVARWLEHIGGNIDFVIIDTTHILPGELLDFLAIYPFLSKDAMIILHDTNLNYERTLEKNIDTILHSGASIATKILLSTAVGEKYVNGAENYLNIGAIKVNSDTEKYIADVFWTLSLTWSCCIEDKILEEYRSLYLKWYSSECIRMFDIAVDNNRVMNRNIQFSKNKQNLEIRGKTFALCEFLFSKITYNSNVVIYGAGGMGKQIYNFLKAINYCHICGWVDKKFMKLPGQLISPVALETLDFDYILIAVEKQEVYEEIKEEIIRNKWGKGKVLVGPFVCV